MKKLKKLIVLALAAGMLATSVLGTSAAFDPVYYAAHNQDVVKALGDSPEMLKLHYDLFGRKEMRMSNVNDVEPRLRILFKADEYAKLFPDVQKAFGDDEEAMFQHYIAFGLLEGRRPSEEVSQAVADSLKKSVEKAMTDAKLEAKPGSAELVRVIKGEIQTTVTTKNEAQKAAEEALQQALTQVHTVVAKAVTDTVIEVRVPKPSAGGGSSSGGSSSYVPPEEPKGRKVTTLEELKAAINGLSGNTNSGDVDNTGGNNILVMNNIDMGSETINIEGNVNLFLGGSTLTSSAEKTFTIKEGVKVSVNGANDKKVNIKNTNSNSNGSIFYMTGGTLHIVVSTLDGGEGACAVKIAKESGTGSVSAYVLISAGILKGKHGICIDESVTKDTISNKKVFIGTMDVSDIYGKESGICLNGYGSVTLLREGVIAGDTVTGGKAGIEIHAGELNVVSNVRAGTNSTAESGSENAAALVVSPNSSGQEIKVTINGGIFGARNGGVPLYVKGETGKSVTVDIPADSTAAFIARSADKKAIQIDKNGDQPVVTDSRTTKNDVGTRDSDPPSDPANQDGDPVEEN